MQDSHISESEAIKLINMQEWQAKIDRMKSQKMPPKQVELKAPRTAPMVDRKSMAGGIDE